MMKKYIALILVLGALSCGYWKTTKFQPRTIATIPSSENPGGIKMEYVESGIKDLSFHLAITGGKLYCADSLSRRIQVMDRDGSVNLIISSQRGDADYKDAKHVYFNFSYLGHIVVDSDGRMYVQNKFTASGPDSKSAIQELDFTPSYILVFDSAGNLQETMGRNGSPNIPFHYIESLFMDREDRLFVISRTFDSWSVARFKNKKRDFYANLGKINFNESHGEEKYRGAIENISIFKNGTGFLVSVAYYHASRFKYRKIMEYSVKENKIVKTVLNTLDPKNELYASVDDKYLYLWDTQNRDVKFVIYNYEGSIMNNILIKMHDEKSVFSDLLLDGDGQFYSYHVSRDAVRIKEWK